MEVKIIKSDKNEIEVKIDNITVAEILRVYLNKQGVEFVAWRKDHPSQPVNFKIMAGKGKDVKKLLGNAISAIKGETDSIVKGLKSNSTSK